MSDDLTMKSVGGPLLLHGVFITMDMFEKQKQIERESYYLRKVVVAALYALDKARAGEPLQAIHEAARATKTILQEGLKNYG